MNELEDDGNGEYGAHESLERKKLLRRLFETIYRIALETNDELRNIAEIGQNVDPEDYAEKPYIDVMYPDDDEDIPAFLSIDINILEARTAILRRVGRIVRSEREYVELDPRHVRRIIRTIKERDPDLLEVIIDQILPVARAAHLRAIGEEDYSKVVEVNTIFSNLANDIRTGNLYVPTSQR